MRVRVRGCGSARACGRGRAHPGPSARHCHAASCPPSPTRPRRLPPGSAAAQGPAAAAPSAGATGRPPALPLRHLGCHGARYVPNARGWYAYPVRTVRGALGASRPAPPVRTQRGRLVRVARTYPTEAPGRTCQPRSRPSWTPLHADPESTKKRKRGGLRPQTTHVSASGRLGSQPRRAQGQHEPMHGGRQRRQPLPEPPTGVALALREK